MSTASIVLWVIGVLALIEALIVLVFPKWSVKFCRKMCSTVKKIKKVAVIELIVAIILLLIAMNI